VRSLCKKRAYWGDRYVPRPAPKRRACAKCGKGFYPKRTDARFCSVACKQTPSLLQGRQAGATASLWMQGDYTGPEEGAGKGLRLTSADRSILDRQLAEEVDIRGNLNVRVNAPAGVEVKATADGDNNIFEGGLSLDRQMQLPTLQ